MLGGSILLTKEYLQYFNIIFIEFFSYKIVSLTSTEPISFRILRGLVNNIGK